MKIKRLRSWESFDKEAQILLRSKRRDEMNDALYPLIFRGQSDSSWPLESSLERVMGQNQSLSDYYSMIFGFRNQLEAFSDRKWVIPTRPNIEQWLIDNDNTIVTMDYDTESIPALEYMAYLRHHAYPSPMLDWSNSPYVAAFFAFRNTGSKAKSVAIYSYVQDQVQHGYYVLSENPQIVMLEHNVRSDRRHYAQQSIYTICVKQEYEAVYANHENVLVDEDKGYGLTKYILPSSERAKALRSLQAYNINAYSLFGSEESLLESFFASAYIAEQERTEAIRLRERHIEKH